MAKKLSHYSNEVIRAVGSPEDGSNMYNKPEKGVESVFKAKGLEEAEVVASVLVKEQNVSEEKMDRLVGELYEKEKNKGDIKLVFAMKNTVKAIRASLEKLFN